MPPKVSIIIPAYNEEKYIQKTIESLRAQKYYPMEIIVVVNGSRDKTFEIAERYADKVLDFSSPLGVCVARNKGAKIAKGDIFIFLDADSQLSENAIEEIVQSVGENTLGSCVGRADNNTLREKLFFLLRNWIHRLKIYKGVIAVLFCHRNIFEKINGFDEGRTIGEYNDFIKKALAKGGKYKLLTNCYVITSLRRYEKKGYFKVIFFWARWRIVSLFKKENEITEKYFKREN